MTQHQDKFQRFVKDLENIVDDVIESGDEHHCADLTDSLILLEGELPKLLKKVKSRRDELTRKRVMG